MASHEGREVLAALLGEAVYANRELHPRQAEAVALHILMSDWLKVHDAEVRGEALRDAADAFGTEGLALKPGGWGSNPADVQTIEFARATQQWLRDRADSIRGDR